VIHVCVSPFEERKTLIFTSSGLDTLTTSEGNTDVFSYKYIFVEELTGCPLKLASVLHNNLFYGFVITVTRSILYRTVFTKKKKSFYVTFLPAVN
jgi:hypothetical protein